jgi:hypothetical protein
VTTIGVAIGSDTIGDGSALRVARQTMVRAGDEDGARHATASRGDSVRLAVVSHRDITTLGRESRMAIDGVDGTETMTGASIVDEIVDIAMNARLIVEENDRLQALEEAIARALVAETILSTKSLSRSRRRRSSSLRELCCLPALEACTCRRSRCEPCLSS